MPNLNLYALPRYLFAPLAFVICCIALEPAQTIATVRDLSVQGLAGYVVAGLATYYLYRAFAFDLLQRSWQLVEKVTPQKFIRGRYVDKNGKIPQFDTANEIFLATIKDLPISDRVTAQNAAIHGLYQAGIVGICFTILSIWSHPTHGIAFLFGAITSITAAYILNGRADAEEVNLLKHHLNALDAEAAIYELKVKDSLPTR